MFHTFPNDRNMTRCSPFKNYDLTEQNDSDDNDNSDGDEGVVEDPVHGEVERPGLDEAVSGIVIVLVQVQQLESQATLGQAPNQHYPTDKHSTTRRRHHRFLFSFSKFSQLSDCARIHGMDSTGV